MRSLTLASLAFLLALSTLPVCSQTVLPAPPLMNFQGRLSRPDGTPLPDGNYALTLSLWDAPNGGSKKWEKIIPATTVRNGVFGVLLDNLTDSLFQKDLWLEIQVGTDVPLVPRQKLVSVAYAFKANSVPDGSIGAGQLANGSITADKFAANTFNPLAWLLNGNSGVTGGFLGTTDNNPLEFRVNNLRAVRYEYAENTADPGYFYRSINILGGSAANSIGPGVIGGTIAGGGLDYVDNTNQTDKPNTVSASFGTISGGYNNFVSGEGGTIGGGTRNQATRPTATVGGGYRNIASGDANISDGDSATVAGGYINTATGNNATVGGGIRNQALGDNATVPGGSDNIAAGKYSLAAGRTARANHPGAFVWADNSPFEFASTGDNQFLIRASGGVGIGTTSPTNPLSVLGNADISGRMGIGTAAPSAPLHILNSGYINAIVESPSVSGTWFSLRNTSSGGRDWSLFSSGNLSGEGTGKLVFRDASGGGTRMVIDTAGNVGIGTISPSTRLSVSGNADISGRMGIGTTAPSGPLHVVSTSFTNTILESAFNAGTWLSLRNTATGGHNWNLISSGPSNGEGAGKLMFNDQSGSGTRMVIDATGNVGIGTSSPAYRLEVSGDINATGKVRAAGVALTSDARYKTNVQTFENALETILNLRGVTFDWDRARWKEHDFGAGRQVGFIAQEVEKVLPELVSTDRNGYKAVAYQNIVPVLVEAVKTLQTRHEKEIKTLRTENAELKVQVAALAAAVADLRAQRK